MSPRAATTDPVPKELELLKRRWDAAGHPAQSAIVWPRQAWMASFAERQHVLERLPDRVCRDDVRQLAARAADSEELAVDAFVAAMVWGYGNVGYGRWGTRRVLEATPRAPGVLRRAVELQASSGSIEAYRFLANDGRMKYLGPAFGTKLLHFVPQHDAGPPALILDAIVSKAVKSISGIGISAATWRTSTFERYLSLVCGWSSQLDIDPAETEMLLFISRAPGQWSEAWLRDTPAAD